MKRIEFNSFSITLREVLVAIAMIALLLTIGIKISDAIERSDWEKGQKYATAAQAQDESSYQWLVKTNIGNLLAYGTAECINPVSMDGIDGVYWYLRREYQEYTKHTRQVDHTYTDSKGNSHTYYTTEVYYTWDTIEIIDDEAKQFTFLGLTYNNGDLGINKPWARELKTDEFAYNKRYIYYGAATSRTGTVFTNIMNNVYSDSSFSENCSIESVILTHNPDNSTGKITFWIFWTPLVLGCAGVYIYFDNEYLED